MTKQEAINILTESDYFWLRPSKKETKALNMAIEALEQEPCDNCVWFRQGVQLTRITRMESDEE